MAFWTGFGASVAIKTPLPATLCTAGWTMQETVESTKRSHAGTGGVKVAVAGDVEYTGTFDLPFDDTATLESVGIVSGSYASLRMRIGGSTRYYEIFVMVKSRSIKATNEAGAVMLAVTWEGAGPLYGPKS